MYRLLLICAIGVLFAVEAKPLSVQVSAPSAILMNLETGAILYAKDIHQRNFPASVTKIATALYVLEKKGRALDEIVQASQQALITVPSHVRLAQDSRHPPYRLEIGGSQMGVRPGETLSLSTLLYGLLLSSGNDAANVLAESVSGSIDQFMKELNQFLIYHGIVETHFENPHGLHHPNHWTTVYDLAQMTRLAYQHPAFREIVKTTRYLKPQSSKQPQYLVQTNRLLKPGSYYYSKAIGVKTGYTSDAGYTLVGAATHEGRTLVAVLLNCSESHERFRDAIRLFEAAFSEKKTSRTLFASESDHFTRRIRGANRELRAILKEDIVLEYYPAEEPRFHAEIAWTRSKLPLSPGDLVGHLRCLDEKGNRLIEKPLFASNHVSRLLWASVLDACQSHKTLLLAIFLGGQVGLLLLYFLKKNQKIRE